MKTACRNQIIHHCQLKDQNDCDYLVDDEWLSCESMDENGYCTDQRAWPENQEAKDGK